MNEIKRYRFNDLLCRLFGLETNPAAVVINPEVQAGFEIEPYNIESRFLGGWRSCSCRHALAPAVGAAAEFRLRNPTGSGVLLVLELVAVASGANDQISLGLGAIGTDYAQLPAAPGRSFRDPRNTGLPTGLVSGDTAGAGLLGGTMLNLTILANDPWSITDPEGICVIPPGYAVDLLFNTQNITQFCSFWWRERAFPTEER